MVSSLVSVLLLVFQKIKNGPVLLHCLFPLLACTERFQGSDRSGATSAATASWDLLFRAVPIAGVEILWGLELSVKAALG